MKLTIVAGAIALLSSASVAIGADEAQPLEPRVVLTDKPARLVELTAHLRVTNSSDSDVLRYVFRVTVPPDLDSQRSIVVASDVVPASRKQHKNKANEYLEFHYPVPAHQEVIMDVKYLVLLMPVDYSRVKEIKDRDESNGDAIGQYLKPSRHIESDSAEVQQAASLVFRRPRTDLTKARAAYEVPAKVLRFKIQKEPIGARRALQTKLGDCTEYACLFAALCRTQSLPARTVGVFNLGSNTQVSMDEPNHVIAEVHLASLGWIPVDPNLGQGGYKRPIGFGKLGNTIVLLNREGAWVWSTWLPPDGYDKSMPKPTVNYGISWDAKVVKQGPVRELYRELYATNKPNGP